MKFRSLLVVLLVCVSGWPGQLVCGQTAGKAPATPARTSATPPSPEAERFAAISKQLSEGKSVSPEDMKWAIGYEAKLAGGSRPAVPTPAPAAPPAKAPVDPLQQAWTQVAGQKILIDGLILQVPAKSKVTSKDDLMWLSKVTAGLSYSYSKSRNEFYPKVNESERVQYKVGQILDKLENSVWIVKGLDACGACAGKGNHWDNQSRRHSVCTSCRGSGCRVTAVWNHGAVRAF